MSQAPPETKAIQRGKTTQNEHSPTPRKANRYSCANVLIREINVYFPRTPLPLVIKIWKAKPAASRWPRRVKKEDPRTHRRSRRYRLGHQPRQGKSAQDQADFAGQCRIRRRRLSADAKCKKIPSLRNRPRERAGRGRRGVEKHIRNSV